MTDDMMKACTLCGRKCRTDRTKRAGRCGGRNEILAARAALHMWEEPCISGKEGSGTIFFAGCPLQCVFCQNRDISGVRPDPAGSGIKALTPAGLAETFLGLQRKKANNINLVTPTHFVPLIREALEIARNEGLTLPVVYNTGSYESPEAIRMMEGYADVFLPDLKFMDPALSGRYASAPDYFEVARKAIDEMVSLTGGETVFNPEGIMTRGVIVRHMILPGHTADSRRILKYLYERYGDHIWISIMNQYTPMPGIEADYPELGRRVTRREYARVIDYALECGITNAFIQEGGTADESFIPGFDGTGLVTLK